MAGSGGAGFGAGSGSGGRGYGGGGGGVTLGGNPRPTNVKAVGKSAPQRLQNGVSRGDGMGKAGADRAVSGGKGLSIFRGVHAGGGGKGKGNSGVPRGGRSLTKPNYGNPLYQPSKTLAGKGLYAAGQALAQSEYGPTIAEDRHTIGISNRQGAAAEKLTSGYFDQLGRFTQQGMRAERHIATGLAGQLQNIGSQTAGQLGSIDQSAVNTVDKYSPGAKSISAPAIGQLAQQLAQQRSLSTRDTQAFRSGGAMQGANYRELQASNLGTNSLFGEQQLGQIAQAARLASEPVIAQIAALRAKKGALAAADTAKLREAEITNSLTRQGLGLKGKALQVTAKNDRGRLALAKASLAATKAWHQQEVKLGLKRLSAQKQNDLANQALRKAEINQRAAAAAAKNKTGGAAKTKPLTTHENDYFQGLLDTAAVALKSGKVKVADLVGGQVKGLPRMPQAVAQAAWNLQHYGYLTPANLAALHNMGMTNVSYNGKHVRVAGSGSNPTRGFTG